MSAAAGHALGTAASDAVLRSEGLDRPSMSVLSLGCGEQDQLELLLDAGFRVAGMDTDAATVIACGTRLAARGHSKMDLRHGTLTQIPWPDQSFDFVVCERPLAEPGLPSQEATAHEIHRVLRPGGSFLVRRGSQQDQSAVSVMMARREFTAEFSAAFDEVFVGRFRHGALADGGELRGRIFELLPLLGYRLRTGEAKMLVVPRHRHEDRLLPLMIHDRDPDSDPLLQYDVRGGVIVLKVFGPLRTDRRSPLARLEIDCNGSLPPIDEGVVREGVHAVHGGIAVGVHAMERMLRSADLRTHGSTDLPREAAARLDTTVAQAMRRCDLLFALFRALRPLSMYSGHDCYDEAVDVNVALAMSAPVLVQPKGKVFQGYGPEDAPGRWMPRGNLFRSHLNQRFAREVSTRWGSMDPSFVADARALMERRMGSLSALPYMRSVSYRDRESNASVGWRNFRDALGVPVYEPERPAHGGRVAWIMSLHSFADEPFRWGVDRLWSLYDMFLRAARHVRDVFPSDVVVLRPHPNSVGFFRERGLIEQVESGAVRGPSAMLDIYLQLRLCQHIADLGVPCELSSLQPAEELLRPERSIVVTRHGSILIEASWLRRIGVFSRMAPYAFLYAEDVQYDDADSLHSAMNLSRTRVTSGTATFPSHDDIAKYQAILDTPLGVKRASALGEVPFPGSAANPMRDFDDFRYGPESMEEAASRLLSCLRAPSERAALQGVLGRAPHRRAGGADGGDGATGGRVQ
jgi:SAM-dependent methyltransferase